MTENVRRVLGRIRSIPFRTRRAIRTLPRHARRAVVSALDDSSVRRFVWLFYIPLFFWGIYGTFYAAPNITVEPVMGHTVYNLWVWLCLVATGWVLLGMTFRSETGVYIGLWMQAGGHLCMFWVLGTFWVSAIVGTPWGKGSFTLFALSSFVLGCLWLSAQSGRQIWLKLHPELPSEVEVVVYRVDL